MAIGIWPTPSCTSSFIDSRQKITGFSHKLSTDLRQAPTLGLRSQHLAVGKRGAGASPQQAFKMPRPLSSRIPSCSIRSFTFAGAPSKYSAASSTTFPPTLTRSSSLLGTTGKRQSAPLSSSPSSSFSSAAPSRRISSVAASPPSLPADYVPPTQPPTAKRPEIRKSQLLRTYTSLLRSTPLVLVFQHNNLTGPEWTALRRELSVALAAVPNTGDDGVDVTPHIRIQVIKTRIFDVAMKIVEFFDPASVAPAPGAKKVYNHDLSPAAFAAMKSASAEGVTIPETSTYAQLAPLLVGPLALLTFPVVSPAHLAAALSVLSPSAPAFPAPTRKKNPGYYSPEVQSALQKMLLIGGRIEGRVFDTDGIRWVGGISGGIDSLRAQLIHLLQSAGLGLTSVLEGAGKSLWLTMESRKGMLEEQEKGEGSAAAEKKPEAS